MRFNRRKALEVSIPFCLLVAATTMKPGSESWAWVHTAEVNASVIILLSLFFFVRNGQRTR
jgi:hypothetical protein